MNTSQISNPFSTGGGGNNFERHVQAFFLLMICIKGNDPILNFQIKRIDFQAKHLGFNTDDLMVTVANNDIDYKILCQIKHDISVSAGNPEFQKVILAMWKDFNGKLFTKNRDKLGNH